MDVVATYNYTKKQQIDGGEGQNSIGVFLAHDHQLNGDVAVKEIAKADFPDPNRYFDEARAMFRSDHPNVVAIRVASQTHDRICLSMPYYANGSLSSRISKGPLGLGDSLRMAQQMLAGLGAIHSHSTIHLDIKPSNILFSDRNVAMVADFGQAREIGPTGVTLMPVRMYSVGIPPEAFTNGRRGTVLSDIYQAGVTLYRAVNGDPAFNDQISPTSLRDDIIAGRFPRRSAFSPHVPDRLRRIIRKAMNVDPSKRYASAVEFANALTNVTPTNDWHTSNHADGSTEWTARREKRSPLSVTLRPRGATWCVAVHTLPNGIQRRARTDSWKENLDRGDAVKHLTQLFAALE